jgi:hypothetical protein
MSGFRDFLGKAMESVAENIMTPEKLEEVLTSHITNILTNIKNGDVEGFSFDNTRDFYVTILPSDKASGEGLDFDFVLHGRDSKTNEIIPLKKLSKKRIARMCKQQ